MKKLFTTALVFATLGCFAQGTAGLIAHWDMNGSTADVSGNGHNGHAANVVPVAGADGIPNTAYYFNGSNSVITAPYLPDLNVTQYSICSKVKILGFYSGACEANYIICRGREMNPGHWRLSFDDNAYNGCGAFDTTREVFLAAAGSNVPASSTAWQYSPQIVRDHWYSVVATYNGTTWKIYVDCNLVNTVTGGGLGIGTSTDSISIGKGIYNAAYPYPFKGAIDDIRLYNRVLADTEIAQYCTTCGVISAHPVSVTTYEGGDTTFTATTTITTPSWQWQADTGTGFYLITDGGAYSGTTTPTLTVTGITAGMSGYNFRCLVENESGCRDTSTAGTLTVSTLGIYNTQEQDAGIFLYPNPAAGFFSVSRLPQQVSAHLVVTDAVGRTVLMQTVTSSTDKISVADLAPGIYTVRLSVEGRVLYRQLLKTGH